MGHSFSIHDPGCRSTRTGTGDTLAALFLGTEPEIIGKSSLCVKPRSRLESAVAILPAAMEPARFEQYARIAAVALLILGCVLVLQPFLGAILFAGVLCSPPGPPSCGYETAGVAAAALAALVLVLVMVVALAVPVALAAQSLVVHSSADGRSPCATSLNAGNRGPAAAS